MRSLAAPVLIDTDTTMFVGIGACSGGIRSCGWLVRPHSESTLVIAERLACTNTRAAATRIRCSWTTSGDMPSLR